jgi:LmbE family N-acetylglucosaminyl deacetylase
MRWLAAVALLPLFAQEPLPEDRGAAGLWQSLRQLQTTARVLHITAHPDDEDGPTITMLARGRGASVTLLSLTRGESGANAVTGDFFDRLGVLRTTELLEAARRYGVDVRFTRAVDYGYSKNVAETFRQWDRRAVLRDMVAVIRGVKPHVILSRWSGTPRDGHGNHEAAGILAQEAFAAAGDPNAFPELLTEGLLPWQPLKLYSGNRNALDEWTLRLEHGAVDPVLGLSYSQLARQGLRRHRSQGAGAAAARPCPTFSYYKLLASRVGEAAREQDMLERLDVSLSRWPALQSAVQAAAAAYLPANPAACAPHLSRALAAVEEALPNRPDPSLPVKRAQLLRALELSLGLTLEARVEPRNPVSGPFSSFRPAETFSLAVPGQTFIVAVKLHGATPSTITFRAAEGIHIKPLEDGRFQVTVGARAPYTRAFWHRESIRETTYRFTEPARANFPDSELPLIATVSYSAGESRGTIEQPVMVSILEGGLERLLPLRIGPPVAVRIATEAGILPRAANRYPLRVAVKSHVDGPAAGVVRLRLPVGWRSEPEMRSFAFDKEKEEAIFGFEVLAPAQRADGEVLLEATASYKGQDYTDGFDEFSTPGGDRIYLASPARHKVRTVDVKIASNLRAAFIAGSGDDVPEGMRQLGVSVEMLDADAIATADLSRYNVIVAGIRAYAVRPELRAHNQRLLDFVASGGVYIVQYNTPEFDKNFGPYPYTMGRNPEEVSEEDSPIEILAPADQVFHFPNLISLADFEGWVEQRGSKFWTTWDPRYTALLATHDSGQPPQKGGWLTARHGKGLYVYCAYAWYRQLPYAVPGAARLFANLISLGSPDSPWRKQ